MRDWLRRRNWLGVAEDGAWTTMFVLAIQAVIHETWKPLAIGAIVLVATYVVTSNIKARRVIKQTEAEGKIEKKGNTSDGSQHH